MRNKPVREFWHIALIVIISDILWFAVPRAGPRPFHRMWSIFREQKKKEVWPRRSQSQRLPVHCLWFQKHVMGPSSCTLQAGNGSLWEHWEPTIIVNFNHPAPQGCDFQTFNIELGYSPCILPYFQIPNLIPIYFHLGLPKIFNRLSYMHPEAH